MPMLERASTPAGPDATAAAIADIRAVLSAEVHADADEYAGDEYAGDEHYEEPVLESGSVAGDGEPAAVRQMFGHGPIRLHGR
jgi:hypothetical protein